jgi:hypothetical protein
VCLHIDQKSVERAVKQPISGIDMLRVALCHEDTHIPLVIIDRLPLPPRPNAETDHSGQKQAS